MFSDYNVISHAYGGALAQEIVSHIPKYWSIIDAVLEKHKMHVAEDI
jgi:hypothetical protein